MTVAKKKKKSYQSFPDQGGGSHSIEKLIHLRMPPLRNKSFLDVGCNEGFFCGYAKHQGATRVVGLDMSANFIARARVRFPDCEFLQQTWDKLPNEKFDVILLASAIHYADDQPALIQRLVDQLSPDGTLILELGIVSDPANNWVPVKRSIDTRYFPTMAKIREVLKPFAWKYVGRSVNQGGDPIGRHVIHIKRRRPFAYLLMMPPSYGKTFIAHELFPSANVTLVVGDQLLDAVAKGKRPANDELQAIVARGYETKVVNRLNILEGIFSEGLADEYIELWAGKAASEDIAFDGFIPLQYHDYVCMRLAEIGYFPIRMQWELIGDPVTSREKAKELAESYNLSLMEKGQGELPKSNAMDGSGFVDKVTVTKGGLVITGWAFDGNGNRPEKIAVHVLGKDVLGRITTKVMRNDVQAKLKLPHADVGFTVKLPLNKPLDDNFLQDFSVRFVDDEGQRGKMFGLSANVRKK